MAFDIRAIFTRALGGHRERFVVQSEPSPEEMTDEEMPGSPITAAGSAAASPSTSYMSHGGASNATAFIPEGMDALPSAAVDTTSASRNDYAVDPEQSKALAEVAVMAALVHGDLEDDEQDDLVESLQEVPGLEDFTADDVRRIASELEDARDTDDDDGDDKDRMSYALAVEDRLDDLAGILTDPTLRSAAYQLAVYFCAWDSNLTDEEIEVLGAIAEAFELSDLEARALREGTLLETGIAVQTERASVESTSRAH